MQICKYRYEVAYREEFHGTIKGKQVDSVKGSIQGHDFILTRDKKAIWVKVRRQNKQGNKLTTFLFSMPVSQMFGNSVRSI